ncbi:adenosylcobinamide-GDP ribazoletransferase [Magnetospirillum moscoviense]|uniref:Adenosylcobinamide-GDP ribazoletransferase n=1 Tax=Magnetospirillum moscoviense TaxID=1437059 RepID=A0A178MPG1_9PROT|nr:adenosylcobinamide-GDP ribazoletransferase [Magnetospirillum moscoviense]OAN49975.1 adenosylcobinamide-GDP ribazoletransferase [Magnetospirillum moscoviense]
MTEPPISSARTLGADLHLAASFLTRLPLPDCRIVPAGGLARSMRVFPVVGAVIGGLGGLVLLLADSWLPALPAALLAVLALVLLTGALHEDGLADAADGLGARGDRDRRLEVMRDSRSGAFGVLALIFSVGLRATALAEAPDALAGLGALVAAGALSRALVPAVMQVLPPARADGLGAGAGCPDITIAAVAGVVGLIFAFIGLGGGAVAAVAAAGLAVAAATVLARRAFGGYTGDILGAHQQLAEIAILLAAAGIWAGAGP